MEQALKNNFRFGIREALVSLVIKIIRDWSIFNSLYNYSTNLVIAARKMVKVCCVKHCNNRSTRESDRRYFSIPGTSKSTDDYTEKVNRLTALRRAKWIDAIRGQNVDDVWLEKGSEFVCSDHFQSGMPTT